MTDETTEFDAESDIIEYDALTEDDCYDLMAEARVVDLPRMEARIEIERRHLFEYDDYRPTFTSDEVFQIGVALMDAKREREQRGETHRERRIDDLAETLLGGIDNGMDVEMTEREGLPDEIDHDDDDDETVIADDE